MDHSPLSIPVSSLIRLSTALAVLTLNACDSSGSPEGGYGVSAPNVGSQGSAEMPAEMISSQDGTATILAVLAGTDVNTTLIDTSFSCYDQEATDYSQPGITFTVAGTRYSSTLGNGTIDYDSKYGDFTFSGGPFESDEWAYLSFDNFGQTFEIETGDTDYSCFQHCASLERGFHQFLLNTPELGDCDCRHEDSSDQQTVRLSSGGIYETAQGSGRYTYSDIIDSTSSDMKFIGGPLNGESISYEEDGLTGRQQFRISEIQTFNIAVGASFSLSYVCARLHTPRLFKQYGYAASGASPAPAIRLNGFYYVPDNHP